MDVETLDGLKWAFEAWRKRKRYPRETIPEELMRRACRAARQHGPTAVARATKVGRKRLVIGRKRGRVGNAPTAGSVPPYSRLELAAGAAGVTRTPFAEVEMPTGVKVRVFTQTGEALGLLQSLVAVGINAGDPR